MHCMIFLFVLLFNFSTLYIFLAPLSPTRCPFLSILFQCGTFATILRRFLIFAVTYVYDFSFTRSPLSLAVALTTLISSPFPLPSLLPPSPAILYPRPPPSSTLHRRPVASPSLSILYLFHCYLYLHCSSSSDDCRLLSSAKSYRPHLSSLSSPAFAPSGLTLSFSVASVSAFQLRRFFFSRRLPWALSLTGFHHWTIALPLPPSWQTKDAFSRVLPGVFSRFIS